MLIYILICVFILMFFGYIYYQIKTKNNKNYPVRLAILSSISLILLNTNIAWIIENINKICDTSFTNPKPLSTIELFLVFLLIYGLTELYYKHVFGSFSQKNTIISIFQIGNNEQHNKR